MSLAARAWSEQEERATSTRKHNTPATFALFMFYVV